MALSDVAVLGLTFQVVGIYFLAASIVFKKPRRVLDDLYGIKRGNLREVRDTVYRKNQVLFGMFFLLAGYLLEIYGVLPTQGPGMPVGRQPLLVLAFLVVLILAVSAIINILGIIYTHRSFKRMLVRFLQENPRLLQENRNLTKEMGELLEVPIRADASFEEYLLQIRDHLNLGDAGASSKGVRPVRPARTS